MVRELGVELKGEMEIQFRSGRWAADAERPRPLVVKVPDKEDREQIFRNARKLARSDEWKKVFIAPDMTKEQRAEDKRQELERKTDAEKRTQELENEGKSGKFLVVGMRGRRRVIWTD